MTVHTVEIFKIKIATGGSYQNNCRPLSWWHSSIQICYFHLKFFSPYLEVFSILNLLIQGFLLTFLLSFQQLEGLFHAVILEVLKFCVFLIEVILHPLKLTLNKLIYEWVWIVYSDMVTSIMSGLKVGLLSLSKTFHLTASCSFCLFTHCWISWPLGLDSTSFNYSASLSCKKYVIGT